MTDKPQRVYPIAGRFAVGEPHVERDVESKAEAVRLVKTGAFAMSKKEAGELAYSTEPASLKADDETKESAT